MQRWLSELVPLALAVALSGCGGPAQGLGSEPSSEVSAGGASSEAATARKATDEACDERWTAPDRRLTRFELAYAVTDVFGVDATRLHTLPAPHSSIGIRPDILVGGLLDTSDAFFVPYREIVSELADEVATHLVASCSARGEEPEETAAEGTAAEEADEPSACVQDAIRTAARRLWRRDVSEDETRTLFGADGEPDTEELPVRVTGAVETLLGSDEFFLLRNEGVNRDGGSVAQQRASRLALTLWSSVPDVELLDWAETEAAGTTEGLTSQVERMMADARFLRFSRELTRQWLGLDREPVFRQFPLRKETQVDAPLAAQALDEVAALVHASLDAPVTSLLDAPTVEGSDTEAAKPGAGLLTSLAVLTTLSSAVDIGGNENWLGRGLLIQSAFLCRTWPLASVYPEESWWDNWLLNPASPAPRPDEVALFAERTTEEPCKHCHAQLETLGAALRAFDGTGQVHRAPSVSFPEGTPTNAAELSQWIHRAGRFEPCVATKLATYVLARSVAPSLRAADQRLVSELVETSAEELEPGERTLRSWLVSLLAADLLKTERGVISDAECVVRERPNPLPNALEYRRGVDLPAVTSQECASFEPNRFLAQNCGDAACHGPGGTGGLFVGPDAETTATLLQQYAPNPNGPCADHPTLLPSATGDGVLLSKVTAASDLCGAPMPVTSGPSSLNPADVACLAEWLRGL